MEINRKFLKDFVGITLMNQVKKFLVKEMDLCFELIYNKDNVFIGAKELDLNTIHKIDDGRYINRKNTVLLNNLVLIIRL